MRNGKRKKATEVSHISALHISKEEKTTFKTSVERRRTLSTMLSKWPFHSHGHRANIVVLANKNQHLLYAKVNER